MVRSNTPVKNPDSMRDSIVFPPVPVAWKTSTSYPACSNTAFACSTHGVVTPNIDAAIKGFSSIVSSASFSCPATIPTIVNTAFLKIIFEILLMPATSTIDGIIKMSLVPTYLSTSPEAIVETISFGTPIGSFCIAGVTNEVPPEPPKERIPSNLPSL